MARPSCGCWIYCGCYADGVNQTARRKPGASRTGPAPSGRGRGRPTAGSSTTAPRPTPRAGRGASARRSSGGTSRSANGRATTRPTSRRDKPPDYRPPPDASGPAAIAGDTPFIMQADQRGWLFAPAGVADGPLPTHYEPQDSPVRNPLYRPPAQPVARRSSRTRTTATTRTPTSPGAEVYPYRRHDLPADRALHRRRHGALDAVPRRAAARVLLRGLARARRRARARARRLGDADQRPRRVEARVMVTDRMTPLQIEGRAVHRSGCPTTGARTATRKGDSMNELSSISLDPSSHIQEVKALSVDIRPGRRPRGPARRSSSRIPRARRHHRRDRDGAVSRSSPTRRAAQRAARRRRPGRRRRLRGAPAADGLLHRHLDLHRLQGVRGRVQGVEPGARGRPELDRHLPRQHRQGSAPTRWRHVAFIEQRVPVGGREANFQRGRARTAFAG